MEFAIKLLRCIRYDGNHYYTVEGDKRDCCIPNIYRWKRQIREILKSANDVEPQKQKTSEDII